MTTWPIAYVDVAAARAKIAAALPPTPLRRYPVLDDWVGHGVEIRVKHENHQPTGAFKVRNGLAALLSLEPAARARGVVAATRGNHGQGLAWAGRELGIPVTICVPVGNSPGKNRAVRDLGATLIEDGRDYDESVALADRLVAERGLTLVHSTNNRGVIAGAATITDEILDAAQDLDAMVVAVGGGSQAVGALTAVRERRPAMAVYGVQAAAASAICDGWHAGEPRSTETADTIADGLATRSCYPMTFPALCDGLAGFVKVGEGELAEAVRAYLIGAHSLAEPAGAAGLAGLRQLGPELAGKRVAVILSGGNIEFDLLRRIVAREI